MKKTALLLVSSQIVLIAATLAVAAMLGHANAYAAVFWLASLLVFCSAFLSLGTSLTISPIPNNNGLRQGGVYRYIRHPMYLAVLLFGFGALALTIWATIPFLPLVAVLAIKINVEEKLLSDVYPDFAQYQARTKRLIPFVW